MKFNVGDKVRVKSRRELEAVQNRPIYINKDMFDSEGCIFTVNECFKHGRHYTIYLKEITWMWGDYMFDPVAKVEIDKSALANLFQ